MYKYNNFRELESDLDNNPELLKDFSANPKEFISKINEQNPHMDKITFKWVIGIIGCVLVFSILASTIYIFMYIDKVVPTFLVTIGSTALGALVGLLSPNPNGE